MLTCLFAGPGRRRGLGLLGFLLFLAATLPVAAQPAPIRYGHVEPPDFAPDLAAADTTAPAIILCDYGQAYIDGTQGKLQVAFERTVRFLIRKPSGFTYASHSIDVWNDGMGNWASVRSLRGATYNLVDGRVKRDTLAPAAVFRSAAAQHWRSWIATLPQVRAGAIVEFTYRLRYDDIQRIPVWTFQCEIPTRWSEFRLEVPTILNYNLLLRSAQPLAVNEHHGGLTMRAVTAQTIEAYRLPINPNDLRRGVGATFSRWVLRDVPALPNWSFLASVRDYQAGLQAELKSMALPGYPVREYTTTWERVDELLRRDEQVGQRLAGGGFLQADIARLRSQYPEAAARAAAVYAWVRQQMKYNGQNAYWTERPLRQAWASHLGSAAEINLLLVLALREAGLSADPVFLGTRAYGRVLEAYPSRDRFNYVAAALSWPDGSSQFLDATDPLVPVGMLPERLLGVRGRIVPAKGPGHWVTLEPGQRYVHLASYTLQVTPTGDLQGRIHLEDGGYAGLRERRSIQEGSERAYFTKRLASYGAWQLSDFHLEQPEDFSRPIKLDVAATQLHTGGPRGALVLELPIQLPALLEELLHAPAAPGADFGAPHEWRNQVTLTLPPAYTVGPMPAPLALTLPNDAGRYSFAVDQPRPGQVVITSRLQLRQASFGAADCMDLQALLRQVAAKSAERLVVEPAATSPQPVNSRGR